MDEGDNPRDASAPAPDAPVPPAAAFETPEVRSRARVHWSWVWLVPLLALAVAASLVISVWVRTGPTITVSFVSAAGLEVGQTKLRYRDVVVGEVTDIRVADDRQRVLVDVQLRRSDADFIAREGSQFWVVRPQVSFSGVSGLNTLLSGAYLSVDTPADPQDAPSRSNFTGLENPPEVLSGQRGTRFELRADELGSLTVGSRVYYRRIEVGRVVSFDMADDGRSVELQVFVEKPYDAFVTRNTRFWNASGIEVAVSPDGVKLRTDGLSSVLSGGIAFTQADEATSFDGEVDTRPAPADTEFKLFPGRDQALADPDGPPAPVELRFDQSVHGLRVGAAVNFRGLEIGNVVDIDLEFDAKRNRFYARVKLVLYPERFSEAYRSLVNARHGKEGAALLDPLVENGLRAQLRPASLLTGQQYIALDFFPNEPAPVEYGQRPEGYLLPTVPGDFDRLQRQVGSILTKLDGVPVDDIGQQVLESLQSMQALLKRLDDRLVPQASRTLDSASASLNRMSQALGPDAPLLGGLQATLRELEGAARALRMLADLLQARPEVLIRGHGSDRLH